MENTGDKPRGYLTVGEMAHKMNVSVRTLQYYDREGLLKPSALSEGGRRLYTYRDMVMLHQILSLKHLGFSLADIRESLLPLDDPRDVADVLAQQAEAVRAQIAALKATLENLTKLREEVLSMKEVDFRCYADIVINLEMRNDLYWAFKYFDADTRDEIRAGFDQERGRDFLTKFQNLQSEAAECRSRGLDRESPEAQDLAHRFWALVLQFTDGDPQVLSKLVALHEDDSFSEAWNKLEPVKYLEDALSVYLERQGINPFGG